MIKLRGIVKEFVGKGTSIKAVDQIDLDVSAGEFVTLLGPSGCGKTTVLRLIAGLEHPTAGEISIDNKVVCAPSTRIFVGANRRPIGIVFQSYAIWPHMTVMENVAFPLEVERPRVDRNERRDRVMQALDLVGLGDLADRPAPLLSGGQQQRVALARALVREPQVLLLDEPLSNLDATLRDRMRDEIRSIQKRLGITTVFVTHDQAEALAISDTVVVMNLGKIVEKGLPQEIYASPRSEFTASFLGIANRMAGTVSAISTDSVEVKLAPGSLWCRPCNGLSVGDNVGVFMRPESFRLSRTQYSDGAWPGRVAFSIYHGDCWDYHIEVGNERLRVRAYREKVGLSRGDRIFLEPDQDGAVVMLDAPSPSVESGSSFDGAATS